MTGLLYRWPAAARFGRRVPKEKLYQAGTVTPAVRERLIEEVQSITWTHKLADVTINLPGSTAVPEVQVFQVAIRVEEISESILIAIDKAIPFPIIYELSRDKDGDQQVRMVATHKQLGIGTTKLSAYFSTGWLPVDTERQSLPTAITLPALYMALLEPLLPIAVSPGETVADVAARLKIVQKLEREISTLERKLRTEPQLNRKIVLRRALKAKQAEMDQKKR